MKIVTYSADHGADIPQAAQSVAYIHLGADGFLPVVFRAETSARAYELAQEHWDKAKGDAEKAAAPPKKRKASAASSNQPDDEDEAV